jgi:hypothetical protein
MKINNFALIIGAMKAGTTSLYNYLIQIPEIAPCHNKEINFFGNHSRFSQGFDFYENLWDWNPNIHKIALEASPSYTRVTHPKQMNAAKNVAKVQKNTGVNFKFIYIMRNPIDRIESHYTHGRKNLYKNALQPLSQGINNEIIDTSKYAMQIDEYYKRFASENILLLNFDRLKNNPELVISEVCQFLEVKYEPVKNLSLIHNPYKEKFTRVWLPGYSQLRKTNFIKNIVKFNLNNQTKDKLQSLRNLFSKETQQQYVKLNLEQRQYVLNELRDDLQQLKDNYGFDISSWQM